ncbi:MAG: hypothetical protein RLZZ69_2310 [Cyanobacteriota bacterium]|jgi:hypothetical protein
MKPLLELERIVTQIGNQTPPPRAAPRRERRKQGTRTAKAFETNRPRFRYSN